MAGGGKLGFFEWLDNRAVRKVARQKLLIEHNLDVRSMLLLTFQTLDARMFVAFGIIGMFGYAFFREANQDVKNLMVGALIAAFAGSWGYYLGSSNTATRANDRADANTALASEAMKRLPVPETAPDLNLAPGETATVGATPSAAPSADRAE